MNPEHVYVLKQPLAVLDCEGKFDIVINVVGGGITGQAGACRHGIARALAHNDETNISVLRANGFSYKRPENGGKKEIWPERCKKKVPVLKTLKENIQRISERGSAVEIILSDSSPFFIMPEDFACLEISEGEDISPDEYEKTGKYLMKKRRAVKKISGSDFNLISDRISIKN